MYMNRLWFPVFILNTKANNPQVSRQVHAYGHKLSKVGVSQHGQPIPTLAKPLTTGPRNNVLSLAVI